jgi:hypothetical protein
MGSGSGSGSGNIDTTVARVDVTVDKGTIDAELRTSHQVTVTFTSVNDFAGTVSLTGSAVDGSNLVITGWTVALDESTVTLTAGGPAPAVATLAIPTLFAAATGSLKIDATSSAAPATATSTINVANQLTYRLSAAGQCTYPLTYGKVNSPDQIKVGTKVRWFNQGANDFEIHIGSGIAYGFTHQGQSPGGLADPKTEPTTAYEQTATAVSPGDLIQWYCHQPTESNVGGNSGYFEVL